MIFKGIRDSLLSQRDAKTMRQCMFNGAGVIRNRLAGGGSAGAGVLLEELIQRGDMLSNAYGRMLVKLRVNDSGGAVDEFSELCKVSDARDYARLIVQLDSLEAEELYKLLRSFQSKLRERRITEQKKRDELMSDLLYLPVVLNMTLIVFDFVYICYFAQQRDMLAMLIG